MGQGFLRRHLVQIAALTVAVVAVAVLAVVALRPSGGRDAGGGLRSPVTSRATATPDPRVDEVKAVARRYLAAFWESAKTGDTTAVDALTEKDSQAYGEAATAADISKSAGHNFIVSRIDFDDSTWSVDMLPNHASVSVAFRLFGHDADWPSMRAKEVDHETTPYQAKLELEVIGNQWLIFSSR